MDGPGDRIREQNVALVILAFLQVDCRSSEYNKELLSLQQELSRDINYNGPWRDPAVDGDLETDGHISSSSIIAVLGDLQPSVELQWPGNDEEVAALQHIAEELRGIAAQFEDSLVIRASNNLHRNISNVPSEQWKHLLTQEVTWAMEQGIGLEHLPQERVFMALTLTLVRGVCQQAPRLLRNLFNTALQYISLGGAA